MLQLHLGDQQFHRLQRLNLYYRFDSDSNLLLLIIWCLIFPRHYASMFLINRMTFLITIMTKSCKWTITGQYWTVSHLALARFQANVGHRSNSSSNTLLYHQPPASKGGVIMTLQMIHTVCMVTLLFCSGVISIASFTHIMVDFMTWKCRTHYWPFVRGIYRWLVYSSHKGPVILSLGDFLAWANCWTV